MWQSIKRFDSTDTDVTKFVFTQDNAVAEAILYKYGTYDKRTVICCSTQSGCPMGCTFCGTGQQFIRNLTSKEIIAQVKRCLDVPWYEEGILHSDIESFQIMFMSMGEPMLNFQELEDAIRILHYAHPNAKLLISTSAPDVPKAFDKLIILSQEIPEVGLQFSVHESNNEARDKLIPFKAKMDLGQIAEYGERWCKETGRKPFFNYCVHEGNNSLVDVWGLSHYFNPEVWEATISVICESEESVASSINRQEELANNFSGLMVEAGYNTRVFNPSGQDDIGGGCGQLFHTQRWMKENAEKTRKMKYSIDSE